MECKEFEITLLSADDLPDVRNFLQMKAYAKVSIQNHQKTPADMEGEKNPVWNFSIEYAIGEAALQQEGINLSIKLYCERTLEDRFIEVNLPLKELFDNGSSAQNMSYAIAGTPEGRLSISYRFGDRILVKKPSGWNEAPSGWLKALDIS